MKYIKYIFFLIITIYRAKFINNTEYNIIRPEENIYCYYLGLFCEKN